MNSLIEQVGYVIDDFEDQHRPGDGEFNKALSGLIRYLQTRRRRFAWEMMVDGQKLYTLHYDNLLLKPQ